MVSRGIPETEEAFASLLETIFTQLTGLTVSTVDPIYCEKYSHGGMSSGYVLPEFWRETALPLLQSRYRQHGSAAAIG